MLIQLLLEPQVQLVVHGVWWKKQDPQVDGGDSIQYQAQALQPLLTTVGGGGGGYGNAAYWLLHEISTGGDGGSGGGGDCSRKCTWSPWW